MINLLPKENRRQLHAMRQNNLLVRYVMGATFTLIAVIGIHIGTYALLKAAENSGENNSRHTQAQVEKYKTVEKEAKEYAANLATAKQIFENKIPYTDAIINLASQLPAGVVLNEVPLDQGRINQPTTLVARAKSMEAALQLKDDFNDSPIAKDVSIASVNSGSAAGGASPSPEGSSSDDYPFSVTLNITFTDELLRPQEAKK